MKRCIGNIYGNYSTKAEAKLKCISDSNCKEVYVQWLSNVQSVPKLFCNEITKSACYHLCHQTAALESNPGYPVYIKLGIQTFDSSTVVLVLLKLTAYRYRIVVVKCIYFF